MLSIVTSFNKPVNLGRYIPKANLTRWKILSIDIFAQKINLDDYCMNIENINANILQLYLKVANAGDMKKVNFYQQKTLEKYFNLPCRKAVPQLL